MAAAEGADLLILARDGDRAHLGPRSLGPASRFIVDHAPCPRPAGLARTRAQRRHHPAAPHRRHHTAASTGRGRARRTALPGGAPPGAAPTGAGTA